MGLNRHKPELPLYDGKIKKKIKRRWETATQKFVRLGKKWTREFPIMECNPGLGSWIDWEVDLNEHGKKVIRVGCKCCSFAKVLVGAFPNYQVSTAAAMQVINFRKHERSRFHKKASACFVEGTKDVSINAPSEEAFNNICDRIQKGQATCTERKDKAMTWCVSEAILCVNQKRVSKAKRVALFRDGRNARLSIRFRAVTPSLDVYRGFLGQERDYGGSALQIAKATGRVMKRFCVRFGGAPAGPTVKKQSFFKNKLFKTLRHAVTGGFF